MKQLKKLASVLLLIAVVMTMTVGTAFAANTTAHTITITNDKAGHTYTAYQVFAGDISSGKLTNIVWGTGVDGNAVLAELVKLNAYKDCKTAEDVADVLVGFEDDSAELDAFAKVVGAHLATAAGSSTAASSPYSISVTGDGYYIVKDTGMIGTDDAATKYILKVVEDVTVKAKAETPTIDKVIVNADSANGGEGKGTAQDMGSVVDFKLTSKVPAMDGYDTYTYIVNDTMSAGLTFKDDVAVTINGAEYSDFTVVQNGQSFTITFNNFINQKSNAGKDIVITYSATINEKALTTDKETNTVNLEYSNNPNDNTSKGKTPDKIVYVYDFDIVIDKYTGDETTGERLAGAEFVLYKTVDSKKLYYFYNNANKEVEWIELADDAAVAAAIKANTITKVTTDSNGAAKFQGLDSGTYYLHETAAPAGYNLLKEDVKVEITATYNADGTLASSTATSTNNGQYEQIKKIENKSGLELPSTGGIGTTIFYVLGAALVIVAGVLLVTRRRMNKNN
ncbi:MAG: SpaH/EbpB family LPXTG-anchored major pilin [Anaerovoracaceae bacterium]